MSNISKITERLRAAEATDDIAKRNTKYIEAEGYLLSDLLNTDAHDTVATIKKTLSKPKESDNELDEVEADRRKLWFKGSKAKDKVGAAQGQGDQGMSALGLAAGSLIGSLSGAALTSLIRPIIAASGPAIAVAAAGAVGYAVGTKLNGMINGAVSSASGGVYTSLADLIYEFVNSEGILEEHQVIPANQNAPVINEDAAREAEARAAIESAITAKTPSPTPQTAPVLNGDAAAEAEAHTIIESAIKAQTPSPTPQTRQRSVPTRNRQASPTPVPPASPSVPQPTAASSFPAAASKVEGAAQPVNGGFSGSPELYNLAELVHGAESGQYGYNALTYKTVNGKNVPGGGADLVNMTIDEVQKFQDTLLHKGHASKAVGKYQFSKATLSETVKAAGISGSAKFNQKTQDALFEHFVRKTIGYDDYKAGKKSWDSFVTTFTGRYPSFKDAKGKGRADGFNGNKATVEVSKLRAALHGNDVPLQSKVKNSEAASQVNPGSSQTQRPSRADIMTEQTRQPVHGPRGVVTVPQRTQAPLQTSVPMASTLDMPRPARATDSAIQTLFNADQMRLV